MIETFAVPILTQAIDFLFEEGRKILQERRERRKAENQVEKLEGDEASIKLKTETESLENINSGESVDKSIAIQSKETALKLLIDEAAWKNSEAEVQHLMSLLDVYIKNYYLAKEQYSKFGSAYVPPIIVHNLTEAEDGIEITTKKLRDILSKLYGKPIVFLR